MRLDNISNWQNRKVQRFNLFSYQKDNGPETAGRWGVRDYRIEIRDPLTQKWKMVVSESRDFPAYARVHALPKPILTDRFRLVVTEVAPLDGQARLLQVEAWGTQ